MKKNIKKMVIASVILIASVIVGYFFIGSSGPTEEIGWAMNFSQMHAQSLGLDWKETYLALIKDMGVKKIKLANNWDFVESNKDEYYFNDLDWQIKTAKDNGVEVVLVLGMKSPRWPECHLPEWAKGLSKEEQQERVLKLVEQNVVRYRDSDAIIMWQVENEPFFKFGNCPWADKKFLKKEVELVRSLDLKHRPVLISDSGEGSFWINAAKIGDVVGTTMYKKVWFKEFKSYITYQFPPVFYGRKAEIIRKLFNKEVICVELQAEPWCPGVYGCSLEEQEKTMNLNQFRENIEFAKKTGLKEFYLWGGEWMYWMKEKQNSPDIWLEAKKLFE
jgi:hypothetical protein